MRVLLHDYSGHPFQVQLSRELANRGHHVLHVFSASVLTPRGAVLPREGDSPLLRIQGLSLGEQMSKYNFLKRRRQERRYASLLAALVRHEKPDLVVSANTPTEVQSRLFRECRRRGIAKVSWVQDIYGVAAYKILRKKLPIIGASIGHYYMWLDRRCARSSDALVLITDDFRDQMRAWGVVDEKITPIPNWAPISELPMRPRCNAWAKAHGLEKRLCFMYSGTLAMKHDPGMLLGLAEHFRNRPEFVLAVISEGRGVAWLEEQAKQAGLTNVRVFPFQPFEQMPDVLGTADVLLAILEPDAGTFSVPSKVLTYFCAGKSLLLSVPAENLAARTVLSAGAGRVVLPGDLEGFCTAAQELADNPALRLRFGERGREYAETYFDIDRIADKFEGVLRGALNRRAEVVDDAELAIAGDVM
jgi:glycosyltransferase involved in cell wall biosynthesis